MALTILLAKVLGIYLIFGGAVVALRRRYFIPVFGMFVKERLTRLIIAAIELVAGLFLIMTHNVWSTLPEGIISLFGWMMAIEGGFYMAMPDRIVGGVIRTFNTRAWYVGGGILTVAVGVYLANFGFGLSLF